MKRIKQGTYFGSHYQESVFAGLHITDTEYTHTKVGWHRHENPYFTYLLQGKLFEANKNHEYYLTAGGLLFHNWQDSHYNIKPDCFTRGFHIELSDNWYQQHDLAPECIEGSHQIDNPKVKSLMSLVFIESKINDIHSQLSIDALMATVFDHLTYEVSSKKLKYPVWIKTLKEILNYSHENLSLSEIAKILNLHPVHLSREFHKYFGTTFGQYIRYTRANKAFSLLLGGKHNLTEICYKCGFYDQSHFIKDFKRLYHKTPKNLIKLAQNSSHL